MSNLKYLKKIKISETSTGCKFELVQAITKEHYKQLMGIARYYSSKNKTGTIYQEDMKEFISLAYDIESSDSSECEKSYSKAKKRKEKLYSSSNNKKNDCDHADLGSLGYEHMTTVKCPICGEMAEVW